MGNNRIKYLVKFVTEEAHANDLLDGKLFMRPSRYLEALNQKTWIIVEVIRQRGQFLQISEEQ